MNIKTREGFSNFTSNGIFYLPFSFLHTTGECLLFPTSQRFRVVPRRQRNIGSAAGRVKFRGMNVAIGRSRGEGGLLHVARSSAPRFLIGAVRLIML